MTIYATTIPRSISTDEVYLTTDINGDITIKDNSVDFTKWQRSGTAGEVFQSQGTGADAEYGNAGWVLIEEKDVSAVSSISFSSLSGYKYYRLEWSLTNGAITSVCAIQFNGVATNNYDCVESKNSGAVSTLYAQPYGRSFLVLNASGSMLSSGSADIYLGGASGSQTIRCRSIQINSQGAGAMYLGDVGVYLRTAQTEITQIDIINDALAGYTTPSLTGQIRLYAKV